MHGTTNTDKDITDTMTDARARIANQSKADEFCMSSLRLGETHHQPTAINTNRLVVDVGVRGKEYHGRGDLFQGARSPVVSLIPGERLTRPQSC